jgi:hypothetical protein
MSDLNAAYAFLPGSGGLGGGDRSPRRPGPSVAHVPVQLGIGLNQGALGATLSLTLAGPGGRGVDPRAVIRVRPAPAVRTQAELLSANRV